MYNIKIQVKFEKLLMPNVPTEIDKNLKLQEVLKDNQLVDAVPDVQFITTLKQQPYVVFNISQEQFETRLDILKQIFGQEANQSILRSALIRSSCDVSKAVSIANYIKPDVLNVKERIVFVRQK